MYEPPVEGNYPRPIESATSKKNWLGCGASVALLAMAVLSCTCGGAQLLAEGPHGPHGEITNDPSIVWMLPLFGGLGIVLGLCSIWLFAKTMGLIGKR
ncbi:MAG: hypothetical protein WCG75_02540 [Armatimonadota bacterium]